MQLFEQNKELLSEATQATISYGTGIFSISLSTILNLATLVQVLGFALGSAVIAVRLIHDIYKLIDYLKSRK